MALRVFCELRHVYSTTQIFIIEIFFFTFISTIDIELLGF